MFGQVKFEIDGSYDGKWENKNTAVSEISQVASHEHDTNDSPVDLIQKNGVKMAGQHSTCEGNVVHVRHTENTLLTCPVQIHPDSVHSNECILQRQIHHRIKFEVFHGQPTHHSLVARSKKLK